MKLSRQERHWLMSAIAEAERSAEKRKTSWWLITGAPGSGKTTLTKRMAASGWITIEDPGRAEFEAQIRAGLSPETVRRDYHRFQHLVLRRALNAINLITDSERVLFDYGIAESLAFMKIAGISWDEEIVRAAARLHFKKIFLLDLVPLPQGTEDVIRNESDESRYLLRDLILELYQVLDHDPIIVPLMSIESRLEMISSFEKTPKAT